MANVIDLNCDMGESYGRWTLGADEAIMPYITSANIACGFHGGDPHVIRKTVGPRAPARGRARGASVTAGPHGLRPARDGRHAGRAAGLRLLPDRRGPRVLPRGRRRPPAREAHGILYTMAERRRRSRRRSGRRRGTRGRAHPHDARLGQVRRALPEDGRPRRLRGFADRAYEVDGTLVSRRKPGALITDPAGGAQAVRMAAEGKVRTIDGVDIDLSVQTICCHGDTRAPSASCARCAGARGGGDPRPAAPGVARLEWPARGRTTS